MRHIAALMGVAVLAGACVISVDADDDHYDRGRDAYVEVDDDLELLLAAAIEPGGVRVRVSSNGCTQEDSFDVDTDPIGGGRFAVGFERDDPDRCRAFIQDGVELFFSREELDVPLGAPIVLLNPVAG